MMVKSLSSHVRQGRSALIAVGAAVWAIAGAAANADSIAECYALHEDHPAVSACLTQRVTGTEGALEGAYKQAQDAAQKMEKITDGSMQAVAPLEASQQAFLAYRKAACDEAIPPMWGGGSGTGDAVADCQIALNRHRIEWLQTNYPAN